jgi:hypothetical protein
LKSGVQIRILIPVQLNEDRLVLERFTGQSPARCPP